VSSETADAAPIRRILVIRTSALGDIVHCLPALRALRAGFPQARIGWVVEDVFAPLLERDPDLDEVLVVRLRRWRRSPLSRTTLRELRSSLAALEAFRPDVVLELMGNHKGGVLAAVTSCERRIGLEAGHRREPSSAMWLSERVPARGSHAVDRALSVAAALGVPREFPGFGADRILAAAAGQALSPGETGAVVIHPGAAWPSKRYPAERWGRVAAEIGRRSGRPVLISAGPGECRLAAEVEAASGGVARPAAASDLPRLVALLAGAALVLGGDTGPLHLAHALGVPTLFLHGPTDPARHGPYGAPDRFLQDPRPRPSGTPGAERAATAAIDIPEPRVVARALALLGAEGCSGGRAPLRNS
jgi:heptosyltransferase-1